MAWLSSGSILKTAGGCQYTRPSGRQFPTVPVSFVLQRFALMAMLPMTWILTSTPVSIKDDEKVQVEEEKPAIEEEKCGKDIKV
jgi:hypothetical protein